MTRLRAHTTIRYALVLALPLLGGACDRRRPPTIAADGKQHYTVYAAPGEVTDAKGAVNIYAATGANDLSPAAARAKPLVYVSNSHTDRSGNGNERRAGARRRPVQSVLHAGRRAGDRRRRYVFDTETGKLTHRVRVGREPHGLCVWPQPGRYSLGHTGNMR